MPRNAHPLIPHETHEPTSVRRIYIQNLTDLLHVCLLRGELGRARRAWSILIRCREVDWKSRWYWGLEILNASSAQPQHDSQVHPTDDDGRETERWLKSLRVSAKEADKPALLHALILHLIKHNRHRAALDELEAYLSSYPYLLSAALHTYAGLIAFYLAQSESSRLPHRRVGSGQATGNTVEWASSRRSPESTSSRSAIVQAEPPNPTLLRHARGWFIKALEIDASDTVAGEFIAEIDRPWRSGESEMDEEDDSIELEREDDSKGDQSGEKTSDDEGKESSYDLDGKD
ncbi:hypothetical protein BCR39DRAFT_531233 [Naematelia encephala]|uniref:Uncharacterized protein n=1 Tax=Naematelia encephala TaxID=71784 RepID=A0A1Y2B4G8_9TREE|nr:hypothetical protein BCR39DRAFT_531233 [Naematelia encephala]